MSGKRAKAERRSKQQLSSSLANSERSVRAANAVLGVDMDSVTVSRVSQFALGWMRAAFEQSRIIANLTSSGMGHAAAPNRRTFWEIALRIVWLANMPQSEREGAADAMLDHHRSTAASTSKHMNGLGFETDIDVVEMNDFPLNVPDDKVLREQAKNLAKAIHDDAAAHDKVNMAFVYRLWREDSMYAHASGFLAGFYAPAHLETVGTGTPPTIDPDLEAHRLVAMLIVFTASHLLVDEGVPRDLAIAPVVAFHGVD